MRRSFQISLTVFLLLVYMGVLTSCDPETFLARYSAIRVEEPAFEPVPEQIPQERTQPEIEDKPLNPLEQHLLARGQVNPRDMRRSRDYTIKVPAGGLEALRESGRLEWIAYGNIPPERRIPAASMVTALRQTKPEEGAEVPFLVDGDIIFDDSPREEEIDVAVLQERVQNAPKPQTPIREPKKEFASLKTSFMDDIDYFEPIAANDPVLEKINNREIYATVNSIRVGTHPGKSRIVIDMDAKIPFSYDIIEDSNLLLVTLPFTKWETEREKIFTSHHFVVAYLAEEISTGGMIVAFKMEQPFDVLYKAIYAPNEARGHRIIFDVASR